LKFKNLPPIETIGDHPEEYAKVITKCIASPVYFVEQFLNFKIHEYNKEFIDCMDRFIVYVTGRQVGKSTSAALKAIHFGYFAPLFAKNVEDNGECNVVIISPTEYQSILIFRKIRSFIHKSPTLSKCIVRETKRDIEIRWFDGGGTTNFIVRPVGDNGESVRGITTHFAIIDECAYIPQKVFEAFLPSAMTTRPKILYTSTPGGKFGNFWEATENWYKSYEKGKLKEEREKTDVLQWVKFHVTSLDNPDTASDPVFLKMLATTTKSAQEQEVYGLFREGGNSLISHNLLQDSLLPIKRPKTFDYYDMGVDTSGKGQDETVIIIFGVKDGIVYPVHVYTENTTEQHELVKKIKSLHDKECHCRRIYIDETGMGYELVALCYKKYSSLNAFGINFLAEKTNIYVNLVKLFEDRKINLTLLEEHHRDKLVKQITHMYWDYGKYKDQKPKVRTDFDDDYSDASALGCFGQLRGASFQVLPDEFVWG